MDSHPVSDSAMADGSLMDPSMEDLFGEAADELSPPPLPPPAALALRIAEMQSRGCCTKLAWSSTGSIAHIAVDGSRITFHSMLRDPKTAVWAISDPSKHPIEAPAGRRFVHIQFSGVGIDLAAVDNVGTTHMFSLASPLGRMVASPIALTPERSPRSELDAVVGMHWLPLYPAEFKSPYLEPAIRNGDKWDFQIRQRDQNNIRIHHPADGRNACVHITRAGELTLLYQNDGSWHMTHASLGPIRSSEQLLSHADIGEDGTDLLAATYDYSYCLRLYRISVNWNATQHSQGPNTTTTLVAPSLEVHHLTAVERARAQHVDTAKLTHLRLIPASSETASEAAALPTVVAIFTHITPPASAAQSQNPLSVIARWQIEYTVPAVHKSFAKIKPGSTSAAVLGSITFLKRQMQDVLTNKVILYFSSLVFDTVFVLGASDGGVDYRDRMSLDHLQSYGDTNSVRGLPQAGFEHVPGDHHVHVSLSADGSGIALAQADGKVVARPMSFQHGWSMADDSIGDNRPYVEAAAACIARQFAFLCYNNASNDESLALIPHDASIEVRSMVVHMICKLMNRTPDIAMHEANRQQMIVLREPLVPRAVSAQLALGTNPLTGERNADGQFAFALLNLRSIGTALAHTLIRPDVKTMPVETFSSMRGFIQWFNDLSILIVDILVSEKRSQPVETVKKRESEQTSTTTANLALRLLLCSFTRTLLRFNVSWIGKYFHAVQSSILPRARSITERNELQITLNMTKSTPFRLQDFERLLADVDQSIRDTWSKSGTSSERRSEIERSMMCDGTMPSELEVVVDSIMNSSLPKLVEKTEMAKLYFWDTHWLGLTTCKPAGKNCQLDVIRKVFVTEGSPIRFCRRCGSIMEDISPERTRELPGWLAAAQRHCVCNNFWILMD